MALANKDWSKISINNVVLEFLRAERDTKFNFYPPWLPIIDNPNLSDPLENHKRLRLLYIPRGKFMIEIPPERWSRLSEQIFRVDKWSVCQG